MTKLGTIAGYATALAAAVQTRAAKPIDAAATVMAGLVDPPSVPDAYLEFSRCFPWYMDASVLVSIAQAAAVYARALERDHRVTKRPKAALGVLILSATATRSEVHGPARAE